MTGSPRTTPHFQITTPLRFFDMSVRLDDPIRLDDYNAFDTAAKDLATSDPVLGQIIERIGPIRLKLERERFRMLCRAILSQQISVAAAKAIRKRFERLMSPHRVTPARVARLSEDQIRSAGVTRQKTRYIRAMAASIDSGDVQLSQLHRLGDEHAIDELTKLLGIGQWTAEMFLMFALGRGDIFSVGDLGLRNAVAKLYGVDDAAECEQLAQQWAPHRSVASLYLWRHVDVGAATEEHERYPV